MTPPFQPVLGGGAVTPPLQPASARCWFRQGECAPQPGAAWRGGGQVPGSVPAPLPSPGSGRFCALCFRLHRCFCDEFALFLGVGGVVPGPPAPPSGHPPGHARGCFLGARRMENPSGCGCCLGDLKILLFNLCSFGFPYFFSPVFFYCLAQKINRLGLPGANSSKLNDL